MSSTILFDYDGVLVDSIEVFSEAVNVAGRKLKQPVAFVPDDLRNIKRMSISEIVEAANVDPNLSQEFVVEIDRALFDRYNQIQLFPEIAKIVQQLREVAKLGIVSATSVAVLQRVLEHQGIKQHFDEIVGGDVPGTKAQKIQRIILKNGSDQSQSCMIGDTVSDIEQGKAAGVITIAVSWGWHAIEWIRTAQPDYEAHQPQDLIDITRQHLLPNQLTPDSLKHMVN